MNKHLIIGSRGSSLALWQANYIADKLRALDIRTSIAIIKTTGDHLQTASLIQVGGKGLFTKEIEEALLSGTIDVAVHSLKDLPTEIPPGLTVAAVPEREDPRDAIVGARLPDLPQNSVVGTSSNRRGAQLRLLRPDLQIESIRGNVDTRLRKLKEGQYAAILLAAAGLSRLGLKSQIADFFSPHEICPAPGQGALAVQTRINDAAQEICRQLNHDISADCVTAERLVLAELGGGCQLPMGAFAQVDANRMQLSAVIVSPNASEVLRCSYEAPSEQFRDLAAKVASSLVAQAP